MTDYDRGEFVRNRTITIEPCANGTFVLRGGFGGNESQFTIMSKDVMGFSSAADMLNFLQSEYAPPMSTSEVANRIIRDIKAGGPQ